MSYTLHEAADPRSIHEREYAIGAALTTTAITSCLVVVGKTANQVIAIHLNCPVLAGDRFDAFVPFRVVDVLKSYGASGAGMLGDKSTWKQSYGREYDQLRFLLGILNEDDVIQFNGVCTLTLGRGGTVSVDGGFPFDLPMC